MTAHALNDTARILVAGGKGLLAMDESNATCDKRFADWGYRRRRRRGAPYRELLVTAPHLRECISGVILYDETSSKSDGCHADATIECLLRVVPAAVPGIAFFSGGQSGELASARLNAMDVRSKSPPSKVPWALTFSLARAIQQPAMGIWRGRPARVAAAQHALYHRARCDKAALSGDYSAAMESASAYSAGISV